LKINIVKTTIIDLKIAFWDEKLAKGVPYALVQAFRIQTGSAHFLGKKWHISQNTRFWTNPNSRVFLHFLLSVAKKNDEKIFNDSYNLLTSNGMPADSFLPE
jgi:hypothetical protein